MRSIRFRSPRLCLALVTCAVAASFPGSSHAAGVYTAVAGPKYSTSRTLSSLHRLDCSIENPYYDNDACSLNIDTASAGCIWEKQSSDGTATLPGSACRVTISGPVPFRSVSAYCFLGTTDPSLRVTYTVGNEPGRSLSPFEFYAVGSFAPKAFNGNATATRQYTMTIKAVGVAGTAGPQSVPVAIGSIKEVFTVDFAYPVKDVCPNPDNDRYSIGNVMDARSDNVQQDNAPTGYIKVDAVTL